MLRDERVKHRFSDVAAGPSQHGVSPGAQDAEACAGDSAGSSQRSGPQRDPLAGLEAKARFTPLVISLDPPIHNHIS
jgi:hypothetical protein